MCFMGLFHHEGWLICELGAPCYLIPEVLGSRAESCMLSSIADRYGGTSL
jgi:hypothetical protein